jgi:DNA-binding PucR family transcriptional regulator
VREQSSTPDGGTNFSDLGVYQILQQREPGGAVDSFVRRWLGALIDYDSSRHADMVHAVAHFLDCGGNYDHAAQSLLIHRSTLRYRLRRIREVGELRLTDTETETETRLNVHVQGQRSSPCSSMKIWRRRPWRDMITRLRAGLASRT